MIWNGSVAGNGCSSGAMERCSGLSEGFTFSSSQEKCEIPRATDQGLSELARMPSINQIINKSYGIDCGHTEVLYPENTPMVGITELRCSASTLALLS